MPRRFELDSVEVTNETARWRGRNASYLAGAWDALSKRIPRFVVEDFKATEQGPANPYIRAVVRLPLAVTEQPIPVGVVSNTYRLAQHADVVEMCLQGIREQGIDPSGLRCELGLTPLGEWMNFRAYFPDRFSHKPSDQAKLALRLECFNSVDGSSRLVILFGWFRFICSNGLVIGETKAALRDIHDEHLDLQVVPGIIADGLAKVCADLERLHRWERSPIHAGNLERWVDGHLSERWGKKAACRAWHICLGGADVELRDPFQGGMASEKQTSPLGAVPGAPVPATNLYDVGQALSWLATQRRDASERLEWQGQIPALVENLGAGPTG